MLITSSGAVSTATVGRPTASDAVVDQALTSHRLLSVLLSVPLLLFAVNTVIASAQNWLGLSLNNLPLLWVFLTAYLFEASLLKLAVTLPAVAAVAGAVEPRVNVRKFCVFLALILIASAALTSLAVYWMFIVTSVDELASEQFYGLSPVLMAVCMYARFDVPNKPVLSAASASFTYRWAPFSLLVLHTLCWIVGLHRPAHDLPGTVFSFWVCWALFRFIYPFDLPVEGASKGPGSYSGPITVGVGIAAGAELFPLHLGRRDTEFGFVELFPSIFHPVLRPVASSAYAVLASTGLVPPSRSADSMPPEPGLHDLHTNPYPSSNSWGSEPGRNDGDSRRTPAAGQSSAEQKRKHALRSKGYEELLKAMERKGKTPGSAAAVAAAADATVPSDDVSDDEEAIIGAHGDDSPPSQQQRANDARR